MTTPISADAPNPPAANKPDQVADDSELDDTVAIEQYDITSYGADFDVEGLVKRLNRGDVRIPGFQRDYVWTQKEASRFVESLLLGLPVPGVFMAREAGTNKLLVIDGQQRLKSLQFFYNGVFNPKPGDQRQRVFKLTKVQPQFENLTYDTLEEQDRTKLNDAIIHATVVKQESPEGDDTSIYYIFERLNNGGRNLAPQEIRVAIYHGPLMDALHELNRHPAWREIYGPVSPRLKDQELILRFLAFYVSADDYQRPMTEFVNRFANRHRQPASDTMAAWMDSFRSTVNVFAGALGRRAFRPEGALNAAVFDATMVGMARRLQHAPVPELSSVQAAYNTLLADQSFIEAVSRSTADEKFVRTRVTLATDSFAKLP